VPVIECSLPILSVHTGKGNTLFEATILHKVRFNLRQFEGLKTSSKCAIVDGAFSAPTKVFLATST
jgi:hypothetical protein